ncbi:MAG TPA: hypothetical protein VNO30_42750 [Kofleriaceae bacterium]|nr:hypothetical protein [Kofleriaceae bacterium]
MIQIAVGGLVSLLLTSDMAGAPAETAREDEHVVLRLVVEPGHTVTFYEPAPGGLYLVERMAPGQSFALRDEAADALRAFQELRPGAPVPAALAAAHDRARATAVDGTVAGAALPSSGCGWGPAWSACRVSWSSSFRAARPAATSGLCTVDHYAGDGVIVQITHGDTRSSFFQGPGTIAQYSLGLAGAALPRRIAITNATDDRFFVGCRWGVEGATAQERVQRAQAAIHRMGGGTTGQRRDAATGMTAGW